ncbi:MAG: DUF126 domain-containing protein [Candidatus Rokubacteria bacterium]|nr:DUF126 domain-containing protein [Candidatus Rokubacteria bacterium]
MKGERRVIVLRGHPGPGRAVAGRALVSTEAFGVRYDLDRETGIISRAGHAIYGQSLAGKILVFSGVKGGMAAGWALADLAHRGLAPLALIFRRSNPVMVQGAIFAGIPILDGLEPDPVATVVTGDYVELDPATGTVTVYKESET